MNTRYASNSKYNYYTNNKVNNKKGSINLLDNNNNTNKVNTIVQLLYGYTLFDKVLVTNNYIDLLITCLKVNLHNKLQTTIVSKKIVLGQLPTKQFYVFNIDNDLVYKGDQNTFNNLQLMFNITLINSLQYNNSNCTQARSKTPQRQIQLCLQGDNDDNNNNKEQHEMWKLVKQYRIYEYQNINNLCQLTNTKLVSNNNELNDDKHKVQKEYNDLVKYDNNNNNYMRNQLYIDRCVNNNNNNVKQKLFKIGEDKKDSLNNCVKERNNNNVRRNILKTGENRKNSFGDNINNNINDLNELFSRSYQTIYIEPDKLEK